MLRRFKTLTFIATLIGLVLTVPVNASAAGFGPQNFVTQQSSFDDQSPDSLYVRLAATDPVCNEIKQDGTASWSSQLSLTNLSQQTPVGISFVERTGGTAQPGESGSHDITSSGSQPFHAVVHFLFELQGAPDEIISLDIPAPNGSCQGKGGVAPVTCYLNNYTDPSVVNEDYSYPVGTVLSMTVHVTDPDNIVDHLYVTAHLANAPTTSNVPLDASQSGTFKLDQPGAWVIYASLFNEQGSSIVTEPAQGCVISLTAKDTATTTPVLAEDDDSGMLLPSNDNSGATTKTTVATPIVKASAKTLPYTGARTTSMVILGGSLVMFGVMFMYFSRKRQVLGTES